MVAHSNISRKNSESLLWICSAKLVWDYLGKPERIFCHARQSSWKTLYDHFRKVFKGWILYRYWFKFVDFVGQLNDNSIASTEKLLSTRGESDDDDGDVTNVLKLKPLWGLKNQNCFLNNCKF